MLDVPIIILITEFSLISFLYYLDTATFGDIYDFIQGIKYTVKHTSLNITTQHKFTTATNFVPMGNPLLGGKQMDV